MSCYFYQWQMNISLHETYIMSGFTTRQDIFGDSDEFGAFKICAQRHLNKLLSISISKHLFVPYLNAVESRLEEWKITQHAFTDAACVRNDGFLIVFKMKSGAKEESTQEHSTASVFFQTEAKILCDNLIIRQEDFL